MRNYLITDPKIKMAKNVDIIDMPVIITINKFDEETTIALKEKISLAHQIDQPVIPIIIDSYGGSVYQLFGMVAELKSSKKPIATIVEGKAMSAGCVLFTCGAEGHRYMSPEATLMIHDVSSWSFGKVEEIKSDAKETERLNQKLFKLMASNCGKPTNYFLDIIHEKGHAEWYLDSKESKKHNLTNHIGLPEMKTEILVETNFGLT